MRTLLPTLVLAVLAAACSGPTPSTSETALTTGDGRPQKTWEPEHYACLRASQPITIDGRLTDEEWGNAPYTAEFIDIEGAVRPKPRFKTRAKLLWDDEMLYVAAEMEDPHLWGSLVKRDSVVWHENDFEIFLDPDGDNHLYYEVEVSPRGTVFDLFLVKPYRDGHAVVHEWDVPGLQVGIHLDGTLNDPSDIDRGWTLELGIPWQPLMANRINMKLPVAGERWRMNLTRVAWRHHVEDGRYVKVTEPLEHSGRPEDNWVWSSQGEVAMHLPEMWGILELRGETRLEAAVDTSLTGRELAGWALMNVYYAQRRLQIERGHYATRWEEIAAASDVEPPAGWSWPPKLEAHSRQFEALSEGPEYTLAVDHEGRLIEYRREADGVLKRRR